MNIFYELPPDLESFLNSCFLAAENVRVDELDCSKSFARQKVNITLGEVLEMKGTPRYSFIYRSQESHYEFCLDKENKETKINYFIWIFIGIPAGEKLVEEYGLEEKVWTKI